MVSEVVLFCPELVGSDGERQARAPNGRSRGAFPGSDLRIDITGISVMTLYALQLPMSQGPRPTVLGVYGRASVS